MDKLNENKNINSAVIEENINLKNHLNVRRASLNTLRKIDKIAGCFVYSVFMIIVF